MIRLDRGSGVIDIVNYTRRGYSTRREMRVLGRRTKKKRLENKKDSVDCGFLAEDSRNARVCSFFFFFFFFFICTLTTRGNVALKGNIIVDKESV